MTVTSRKLMVLFAVTSVLGLISLYQVIFSAWMCAYQVDHKILVQWQDRFYLRFATAVLIAILWFVCGMTLLKRRLSQQKKHDRGAKVS